MLSTILALCSTVHIATTDQNEWTLYSDDKTRGLQPILNAFLCYFSSKDCTSSPGHETATRSSRDSQKSISSQIYATTEQYEWTLYSDDDDEDEASRLCNMAMLCGPPGVGKTSAVYG